MPEPNADPWVDERFGQLDTRNGPDSLHAYLTEHASELPPDPNAPPAPAAAAPEPPAADQPTVYDCADGSTVSLEKTSKGWKATLDTNTGAPTEVFYGKTKEEMLVNIAAAKANATRKIRELNRKVKLGIGNPDPAQPQKPAAAAPALDPQFRDLTADEIFEIKTKLESNPALAFDLMFQKQTGMTVRELVALIKDNAKKADQGVIARQELDCEAVTKAFLSKHPDYYADPEWKNYQALIAYLAKHKLSRNLNDRNQEEIVTALVGGGYWTVANLDEAYEELSEGGLLETAPVAPDEPPELEEEESENAPPPPAPPAPPARPATPPNERIVRETRRPRAGLGIRSSETTASRPETVKPPSVEDLDDLSDEAINNLFAGVRKERAVAQRRR